MTSFLGVPVGVFFLAIIGLALPVVVDSLESRDTKDGKQDSTSR